MKIIFYAALVFFLTGMSSAQSLKRQMKVDTLYMSSKINTEPDKALLIVHSQIANLQFDCQRNIDVRKRPTGDWEIWMPYGTYFFKVYAEGFQMIELPPTNFAKKKTYEMVISPTGFAPGGRADENLVSTVFQVNEDSVYSSYDGFTPTMASSRLITYLLPAGEYSFRFIKNGFKTSLQKVRVDSAQSLEVKLERSSDANSANLSLPGIILINSEPSNAEIIINGQKIGNTPYQGELAKGVHQLEIRKPLYYPEVSTFSTEEGKTKSVKITLKPRLAYLSVSSNVPGSRVYLDEKLIGSTPMSKMEIESSEHQLRVETDLYRAYTDQFKLNDGEEKIITADLKPAFGSLEINSMPESSADVYIDGKKVGTTPFKDAKLLSGRYLLKVTKEFFSDSEEQIIMSDGGKITKNIVLSSNYGELNVQAAGCRIMLDGNLKAKDNYFAKLTPGNYKLKIEREDEFYPVEEDIFLKVGEKKNLTYDLKQKLGSLSIFVEPSEASDADVYVDGQLKGNAPLVFPLNIGSHLVKVSKAEYLDKSEKCLVTENNRTTLRFNLAAYDGSRNQRINRWAAVKWIGFSTAALAGGVAAYFKMNADKNYDSYRAADNAGDAVSFRQKVEDNNSAYKTALYVAAGAVTSAFVSWIIQAAQ